ncbi:MAG: TolC family protein [Gammaproteobacteria bacterium]|nr:TolC family protein [Gammaproteobacteria bacterium]
MKKIFLPALVCFGMNFPASINAEQLLDRNSHVDISNRTITLHEAISKTINNNHKLRAFYFERQAQKGRVVQAGLSPGSAINFDVEGVAGSDNFKGTDNAQISLSMSWVFEGQLRQRYIDLANAGTFAVATEANINLLDVSAETARLYLISLARQTHLINSKRALKISKQIARAIKKRVLAGKTTEAELARAQVDVMRRELELEDVDHELSSTYRLLAAQWGKPLFEYAQVEGDLFSIPQVLSFEKLKQRLEQSPNFARLLSQKRLQQRELKLAKAKNSPGWNMSLGVRHYQQTDEQALIAGISIPFGEGSRNSGGIAEARANLSQLEIKEDEVRVRFETSLYSLHQELKHHFHQIEAYRNKIIPKLEQALKQTRRAYNLGRYSYLELRSVQNELISARHALVEASLNAHLKRIEIERFTGEQIVQRVNKS